MSYVLLVALALNPAFAADLRGLERSAAPAVSDEDEPSDDDEPDDDDVSDVRDVARTLPTPVITKTTPGEEEFVFEEPITPAVVDTPAPLPGPVALDVVGKEVLANNYPASIVAIDRDAVVVELPVLVAKSRAGAVPFVLIASVFVGETKVGEVRQTFDAASLAEFGPTFAFLKIAAPVAAPKGEIKVVVSKAKADGTGATALFTQTTPYQLK